jgi:peptidoglycan/xylan/chitin deacetylase (PgdA/CDA1 family)
MSVLLTAKGINKARQRAALSFAAGALWHMPGRFRIARCLGPGCSLRCVLFHDVSDEETSFTRGLGGTITRSDFEAALKFLTRHYTPVSLQQVLEDPDVSRLPVRPVLVTFDDAYASISKFAAPLCAEFAVPAVFFVNAACLDNQQIALDNLVTHLANVFGMDAINAAAGYVDVSKILPLLSLTEVFSNFLPSISPSEREIFRAALLHLTGAKERDLAAEAGLYLTSQQLRDLATFDFELGNHTYTHANCRTLSMEHFAGEIDRNKAVLEAVSGTKVRSFSVPYGSSIDLTPDLVTHLRQSGYKAVFLSESRANLLSSDRYHLDRVSVNTGHDQALFSQIEVLPRLRSIRNTLLRA